MSRKNEKTRETVEVPAGDAETLSQPGNDAGDVPAKDPVGANLAAGDEGTQLSLEDDGKELDGVGEPSESDDDAEDAPAGEAAAVYTATGDLHPWKKNPRWKDKKKFKKAVRMLMKSIRRFGFGEPMLARLANNEIIAGHTRWAAAKRLGLATVPVRFMDLSEDEAHALALADNKTAEYGEWDEDKLKDVVRELDEKRINLEDGTGFEEDELDEILIGDDDDLDLDDDGNPTTNPRGLKYQLIVECTGEEDQAILLGELESAGRKCKPLMS